MSEPESTLDAREERVVELAARFPDYNETHPLHLETAGVMLGRDAADYWMVYEVVALVNSRPDEDA